MDEKDLQIDNILAEKPIKQKVDGKAKGDRTELGLCKLLTEHFGAEFSRSSGSGNRWSQVSHLPAHAKMSLTGDLCPPEGFLWVLESKGGYEDDIDLNNVCDGKGIAQLDEFIEQSERDAGYCGRKPMILWKRNRKPWLAMVRQADLPGGYESAFEYKICYRDWRIVRLDTLLKEMPHYCWFEPED